MEMKKMHIIGIIMAGVIIAVDIIFLRKEQVFWFILGISGIALALPFLISIILQTNKERDIEEMFIEFSRDLVEGVKSGTPISRSILNVADKNYGSLSPHVKKLANQISLGITVKESLNNFSRDVGSKTISRAITLISEAEKAGGDIEDILEAVAVSVSEIEKLKKERKAAIYSLVVQGYVIFFVFIVIMLVMQFKILAMLAGVMNEGSGADFGPIVFKNIDAEELSRPFLFLLLVQGAFAGLVIGKLAEGSVKAGVKHSFILVIFAWLISTGANIWYG